MINWYHRVTNDPMEIPNFIGYFDQELEVARRELSLKGLSLEKHAAQLPGLVEQRFGQLQEIEAVLEFLNIGLRRDRALEFKKFLEAYNRTLSSRDAEKYVDGVQSIVDSTIILNEVALLRNRFLAVIKGLETKNFMLSNATKLRVAGLDDATIT